VKGKLQRAVVDMLGNPIPPWARRGWRQLCWLAQYFIRTALRRKNRYHQIDERL